MTRAEASQTRQHNLQNVQQFLSTPQAEKAMKSAQIDPRSISAILISHEHGDHVYGLATLSRKLDVPVFMTGATHQAWARSLRDDAGELPKIAKLEVFSSGRSFQVADITVTPFTIPHDAADPVGVLAVARRGHQSDLLRRAPLHRRALVPGPRSAVVGCHLLVHCRPARPGDAAGCSRGRLRRNGVSGHASAHRIPTIRMLGRAGSGATLVLRYPHKELPDG